MYFLLAISVCEAADSSGAQMLSRRMLQLRGGNLHSYVVRSAAATYEAIDEAARHGASIPAVQRAAMVGSSTSWALGQGDPSTFDMVEWQSRRGGHKL
ncbi:hypothetical protein OEZ86_002185 [Tetradesmus obliquus]|nr:hypothetical protein OEZ86_002185 [Tetradesmus obliquus]